MSGKLKLFSFLISILALVIVSCNSSQTKKDTNKKPDSISIKKNVIVASNSVGSFWEAIIDDTVKKYEPIDSVVISDF